jgi:uncharacterized protein (TIGR02001 family)
MARNPGQKSDYPRKTGRTCAGRALFPKTVLKIQHPAPGEAPELRRFSMRPTRLALALALATLALPMSALAQDSGGTADPAQEATPQQESAPAAAAEEEEDSGPLTWSLAVTSDYVFRGITQTDYDPALQAGATYTWGNGLYVGAWTSNVDFQDSDGPDLEFDTYVGWGHDLSDDWNVDLSLVHYAYFGERNNYGSVDYTEVIGKATWNEMLTLTVAYAPDYSNLDFASTYVNLGGTWDIGNDFSINAGVGHTEFAEDNGSYNDWNLGVSHAWGPATFALNYYDTDIDFDADAEHNHASDEVVFSITLGN